MGLLIVVATVALAIAIGILIFAKKDFESFCAKMELTSSTKVGGVEDSGPPIPSRLLGGHNGRGERRSPLARRRKLARMRAC